MSETVRTTATDPPVTGRIAALDVARGVAIMGTFALNVWLFSDPGGPRRWFSDVLATPTDPVEVAVDVLQSLVTGKFLAVLTLLFGVGIELQYRSARRRGRPWPGRYPLRAAALFLEGLVHYLLVFEGDVLMAYALTSLVVAYLVGRSDRAVRVWIAVTGAGFVLSTLAATALLTGLPEHGPVPVEPGVTASWWAQVVERVQDAGVYRTETLLILPSSVALFLVGSRLTRAGAFDASPRGHRLRQRMMLAGLGVGVPLTVLMAVAGPAWFLVGRYLVPPLVAVGILALVTTVVLRGPGTALRRWVAGVGRTALSCYVLQNLLAAVLCYDWGFGLAARLAGARPWWVLALWLAVVAVEAALANLWLRRFDRGPAELLLHRIVGAPRR